MQKKKQKDKNLQSLVAVYISGILINKIKRSCIKNKGHPLIN